LLFRFDHTQKIRVWGGTPPTPPGAVLGTSSSTKLFSPPNDR
jgi:hypothetical protein